MLSPRVRWPGVLAAVRSSLWRKRIEESPGSIKTRCRITSGGGDPRESATENKPLIGFGRSKGETVRQERTARTVTDAAGQAPPGARPNRDGTGSFPGRCRPGRSREAAGDRRPRGMAIHRASPPGDRTRLTGHLTHIHTASMQREERVIPLLRFGGRFGAPDASIAVLEVTGK